MTETTKDKDVEQIKVSVLEAEIVKLTIRVEKLEQRLNIKVHTVHNFLVSY